MGSTEVGRWIWERIHGRGGYVSMCRHEMGDETNVYEAAAFVVRCLVNPGCEGSGAVLDAIVAERVKREAETEA